MIAEDYSELDVLAEVADRTAPFLAGDAPVFGSPEWLALESGDPQVTRAVVRAALAWWRMGEPIEDLEERARAALDVESSHAIAGALDWAELSRRPSSEELRRRRDWHVRRDRPDYPGRSTFPVGQVAS